MEKDVWFKSGFSGNTDNSCVEVSTDGKTVEVRDSKDPEGGKLSFTLVEWAAFTRGVHAGQFEL